MEYLTLRFRWKGDIMETYLHDFNDKMYWIKRWMDCFPCTVPPELYLVIYTTKTTGWWIFKQTHVIKKTICARCSSEIMTGHMCKDLVEFSKLL